MQRSPRRGPRARAGCAVALAADWDEVGRDGSAKAENPRQITSRYAFEGGVASVLNDGNDRK